MLNRLPIGCYNILQHTLSTQPRPPFINSYLVSEIYRPILISCEWANVELNAIQRTFANVG